MVNVKIIKEIFYCLTGALVIFVCLEIVWPRLVLAYLNINWVLILWLIVGIFVLAINSNKIKEK